VRRMHVMSAGLNACSNTSWSVVAEPLGDGRNVGPAIPLAAGARRPAAARRRVRC